MPDDEIVYPAPDDIRAIGMGDTIVGATALVHEEPVLTRNVEHFERIDDLEIEAY